MEVEKVYYLKELHMYVQISNALQMKLRKTPITIALTIKFLCDRPNAMCLYLTNPQMLNMIEFQSQDIQNYVYTIFKIFKLMTGITLKQICDKEIE
ncbi:hypothetical protein RFI_34744 [Reticulomyxa filosa]|uniref:Uncharacterized protein n=1 Tax=Reticulomyxa filosa TaxID=46433 RepID=X6LM16_RETFI|nr:hypothetical protein RFI_34744 [Reticulomyxa filosa]|eukprot:ETO02674.1 hypothetical protein RFI_34744 [Reticulomyxa filosa]